MGSVILIFNMTLTKEEGDCMFSKYKSIIILLLLVTTTQVHAKSYKHIQVVHKLNGTASWYGYESGKRYRNCPKTASGEIFSPYKLTAAHKTLPFGTRVRVTNQKNNMSIIVTINDRGPFVKGRVIDLTKMAASMIGLGGTQKVSLTTVY